MASLTIKNLPDELYEQIKRSAAAHRRSINSELIVGLEKVFQPAQSDVTTHIHGAREVRAALAEYRFNLDEIQQAKTDGRP